jgi:D-lactate dehydrogenase
MANKLSSNVIVPPSATCCGMGGTHGLLHPETVTAATAAQRIEILAHPSYDQNAIGISLNTLCESALSSTTGVRFKGLVEVVWRRVTDG